MENQTLALLFGIVFRIVSLASGYNLTVLHTNDFHSRFEQTDTYGRPCTAEDAAKDNCFGGTARLKTKISELRSMYPNSVLLDAGDQFTGTLWFYKYGGETTAHFMNLLGYDAMALGNHEFDRKPKGLAAFLDKTKFVVLSCNINATLEHVIDGKFIPSRIMTIGGERIGLVGYTNTQTKIVSQAGKLIFLDEITSIRKQVDYLVSQGVNKIIALGHVGFEIDKRIAKEVEGVDIVVGGRTNTFLYTGSQPSTETPKAEYPFVVTQDGGNQVLVVQAASYGKYLGFLQVVFDEMGNVTSWGGNPILLNATIERDKKMLEEMEPYRKGVENTPNQVIGQSHVHLEGSTSVCRRQECNLGNLITNGMLNYHLKYKESPYWSDVTMALINSGGIRRDINRGPVTFGELQSAIPYGNTVDLVQLKGEHVRGALEHGAAKRYINSTELPGAFLQHAGLRVTYNLSKPVGQKAVRIEVLCNKCTVPAYVDIEDEEVYQIAMSSFIADGGDGYSVISDNKISHASTGARDADVLAGYVSKFSPIVQGVEGRIIILQGTGPYCVKWSNETDIPCTSVANKTTHGVTVLAALFLVALAVLF